jgi:serine/threonine protein phosphatase 1
LKQKRTLIIGDIHGNLKALQDVLDKAKFNIDEDRIICIGDYIDGWDESFEVVRTLLEIKNQSKFENVFLLGNHDKWFINILNDDFSRFRDEAYIKKKYTNWFIQGGKSTYESYLKIPDEFILIHKTEFFDKLKYYHEQNNKLFIHAGFDLELGFRETVRQEKEQLIWNRSLYKEAVQNFLINQNLLKMGKPINASNIEGFTKIYIGHTPTTVNEYTKPQMMGNVINVDQGCKKKGILTAWIDETDEYFQNV